MQTWLIRSDQYHPTDSIGTKWWLTKDHPTPGQEDRHRPMFVDGYDPVSQTVYKFHGCHNCFTVREQIAWNVGDRTIEALYQATNEKTAIWKEWGYRVVEIWQCQWCTKINTNSYISDLISKLGMVPPLDPCDAFFGGQKRRCPYTLLLTRPWGKNPKCVHITFWKPAFKHLPEFKSQWKPGEAYSICPKICKFKESTTTHCSIYPRY